MNRGKKVAQIKNSRASVRIGIDASENMRLLPRKNNESGTDYAYRTLEYNILMLNIPPGAWIREKPIAERLNLSKTPVHQAVSLLRDHMLVDVKSRSATHVSRIDLNILRQGFFLRSTVEPVIVSQVIPSMSSTAIAMLRENLEGQQNLLSSNIDTFTFIRLDDEFHHIIYQAADKDLVWKAMRKVTAHFDRVRYMGLIYGYEQPSIHDHMELYKMLIVGRDVPQGEINKFILKHLSHYLAYFDKMIEDLPDYFVLNGLNDNQSHVILD
jgi:DNA-binding GntR family transcriptional regulator